MTKSWKNFVDASKRAGRKSITKLLLKNLNVQAQLALCNINPKGLRYLRRHLRLRIIKGNVDKEETYLFFQLINSHTSS